MDRRLGAGLPKAAGALLSDLEQAAAAARAPIRWLAAELQFDGCVAAADRRP